MSAPTMFVPGPIPATSFNESSSDVGDNFLGGASRNGDASTSTGPLSDTASSNPITDVGLGYPSSAHPTIYEASATADSGVAAFNSESAVLGSHGESPTFGVTHTRSSSWSGYPSSFQNPLVPGEEDGFGATFSGHDRRTGAGDMSHAPSMSVARPSYTNFYLPNSSGVNAPCHHQPQVFRVQLVISGIPVDNTWDNHFEVVNLLTL